MEKRQGITERANDDSTLPLSQLFRYASPLDKFYMFCGTVSAIIHGSTMPYMTIFFGDIITAIVTFNDTPVGRIALDKNVAELAIKMCVLGAITFTFGYLQNTFWMLAGENQTKRIREKYFNSIIRQDIGWFDNISTGDLTNRLSADINKIQEGISDKFGLVIQFSTTFCAGFAIAYVRGWQLALVLTSSFPIVAFVTTMMGKILASRTTSEQKAYGGAGAIAQQVLSSIKTVVAFGGEQRETDRYCVKLDDAERFAIKKAFINGIGISTIQFVNFSIYALGFWYGNQLVPTVLQPGTVINVIFAFIFGAFSLGNATPYISAVGEALGCAKVIFEIIERKSPIDAMSDDGQKQLLVKGEIVFKNIDFHYPTRPDVTVMKDFNLTVKPGTTVALVGSSGSGKSTAIKLIERFYDPVSGQVLLDGVDIKELNVKWLRQQIGVVSQEPCLFDATIRQNILLGLYDFDKIPVDELNKKIEIACKQANCWDFIQQLPLKLETQVGESGTMLSGGQKQRIAIARAIIKNPSILLLDEATSALDTESERIVHKALEAASKDRTTIVVAHRLSTIKNSNVIFAMSLGQIVERGTHEELIARKGLYADLVEAQTIQTPDGSEPIESLEKKQDVFVVPTTDEPIHVADTHTTVNEDAAKKNSKVSLFRVLAWNKSEYSWLSLGFIASMANGASQPIFAILFGDVLTILGTPKGNTLPLLIFGLGIMTFIANFSQTAIFDYSNAKMTRRVRESCFKTLLRQEMAFFDEESNSTGNLTTKLAEDATLVSGLTGQTAGTLIQSITAIGTGLIISMFASWQLALLVTGLVPLITLSGMLQMRVLVGTMSKTRLAYELTNQKANETIQNIRTIATITQENYFYETYANSILVPHKMTVKSALVTSLGFGFAQSIMHFTWATSLYFGTFLMKEGLYRGGDILRAMFAIIFSAFAAGRISTLAPNAAKAKLAAIAIFELLDRKSLIDVHSGEGEQRRKANGKVELTDVTFNYPSRRGTKVLTGISIFANPGKTVALVGHSGCGKSTIMGLLLRWYDNTGGKVDLDSLQVQNWNLTSLRSFIGIVGQEPVLFDISIRDNIAYGAITPPDALQIVEAAKAANIHDFVQTLPNKYDEIVGERGGKMSGGQKQRIAIARALIRNPKVLLLDEATSALDSESEVVVQEALDAAAKGRTTLVIAHRLSTIQNADLILFVNQGVVVESGTHSELVKLNRQYAALVDQQSLN